jgi:hypothetical protein
VLVGEKLPSNVLNGAVSGLAGLYCRRNESGRKAPRLHQPLTQVATCVRQFRAYFGIRQLGNWVKDYLKLARI